MSLYKKYLNTLIVFGMLIPFFRSNASDSGIKKRPNIVWIVSEDNTTYLGCYGDKAARTPNLDRLAGEGILFENAFCNSPVCAPSRSTIITGLYANSLGTQNMRSMYPIPRKIKFFTEYLRDAGYYCTNNAKEDYNTEKPAGAWDESSKNATWENRKNNQPFFSVFNFEITHEGKLHPNDSVSITPLDAVTIPKYNPDTRRMRLDKARYYDRMADLDKQISLLIKKLKDQGLWEETIIVYYGDNGGVLPRSKRFLYEEGTHVPLIVRIPEKYCSMYNSAPGSRRKDIVSFVDLAPTMLSIAGIDVPGYMQGKSFLGEKEIKQNEYAFMFRNRMDERFDFVRAVRNERYRYIRNFMPNLPNGQHVEYLWQMPCMKQWSEMFEAGKLSAVQSSFFKPKNEEELYDILNDPDEINNLASDPAYKSELTKMRAALEEWMLKINDTGFMPEAEMEVISKNSTLYETAGDVSKYKIKDLMEINKPGKNIGSEKLIALMKDDDALKRYWALYYLMNHPAQTAEVKNDFEKLLSDKSPNVRILAAEIAVKEFDNRAALKLLSDELNSPDEMIRLYAINAVDNLGGKAAGLLPQVNEKLKDPGNYVQRVARYIISKQEKKN